MVQAAVDLPGAVSWQPAAAISTPTPPIRLRLQAKAWYWPGRWRSHRRSGVGSVPSHSSNCGCALLISEAVRGEGARLVDATGQSPVSDLPEPICSRSSQRALLRYAGQHTDHIGLDWGSLETKSSGVSQPFLNAAAAQPESSEQLIQSHQQPTIGWRRATDLQAPHRCLVSTPLAKWPAPVVLIDWPAADGMSRLARQLGEMDLSPVKPTKPLELSSRQTSDRREPCMQPSQHRSFDAGDRTAQ